MIALRVGFMLPLILAGCFALPGCKSDSAEHKAITTAKLEPFECGEITRLHT